MSEYGKHLKRMREDHGWTQQQLANKTGLTRDQIAKYETVSDPPLFKFLKICKAFGIVVFK